MGDFSDLLAAFPFAADMAPAGGEPPPIEPDPVEDTYTEGAPYVAGFEENGRAYRQARCDRCGWHSFPTIFRKQALQWAELHKEHCDDKP